MSKNNNASCLMGVGVACRNVRDMTASGCVASIHLHPEQLLPAVRKAWDEGYFLESVTGLDVAEGIEVIYYLDHWERPGRLTLRVLVPHDKPELPSIAQVYSGADWHEREAFDMYGLVFTGHPNLTPLLLPDDADIHPLLKEPAERVSIYHLFPDYDVTDCRPMFLKNGPESPGQDEAAKAEADPE